MPVEPTLVDFAEGAGAISDTPTHRVYLRATWAEEWVEIPYLRAIEVVWSTAPSMPVATLEWQYGELLQVGGINFATYLKLTGQTRSFVKIEVDTHRDPEDFETWISRDWYGVLEIESDELYGARLDAFEHPLLGTRYKNIASGRQEFTCYGLEKLLTDHVITGTYWLEDAAEESEPREEKFHHFPAVFNRGGVGNRTENDAEDEEEESLGYHLFENDPDLAEKWTSGAIVRYLLGKQTPLDRLGAVKVPFRLPDDHCVPLWDAPTIEQEGQTTYSLLDRIINRRRLLTWWLEVSVSEEEGEPDEVLVMTATLTPSEIPINVPLAAPIPANTRQKRVACDFQQLATVSVKASDVGQYDQVIVRGGRRLSLVTLGNFAAGGDLEKGWTAADETSYERGASDAADYATLDADQKAKRNAAVRTHPKLRKVFSFFRIPKGWNRKVEDADGDERPAFEAALGGDEPEEQFYGELFIERVVPLYEEVDYSGEKIRDRSFEAAEEAVKEYRELLAPLVFCRRRDTDKWMLGEEFAAEAELVDSSDNPQFSVQLDVRPDSHGVYVRVHGEPQHAIATADFTALPVDPGVGAFDYHDDLKLTVGLSDGRYFEARWPPSEPPGDCLRHKVIEAGEEYEKIHVVRDTVIGVDKDGALVRTAGGDLIRPKDGDKRLLAIAKLAAAWYCRTHYVVTIETRVLSAALYVGDLVTDLVPLARAIPYSDGHYRVVNAPISEIRIAFGEASGDAAAGGAPPPVMTVTTMQGELDPLQSTPPPFPPPAIVPYRPGVGGDPGRGTPASYRPGGPF